MRSQGRRHKDADGNPVGEIAWSDVRQRKAGYRTRASALAAGEAHRIAFAQGKPKITLADMYSEYMKTAALAVRTRDAFELAWKKVGPVFDGPTLPRFLESHKRPLRAVQRALGLRPLSHHKIGRHSVGGQAMTAGLSPRVLQAQLGHRSPQSTAQYANIGENAHLRLMDALAPSAPLHVNVVSTGTKKGVGPRAATPPPTHRNHE